MNDLIGVKDLAPLLGLSPSTVKVDVSRRPHVLPPRVVFPNSRRVRWSRAAVIEWIRKQQPRR